MDNQTEPVTTPSPAPMPQSAGPETNGSDAQAQALGYVKQFEMWLESVMVTKAPFQIPMGGKEFLATIAPYLIIIGIVIFVLSLPVLLGLGALTAGLGMMSGSVWGYSSLVALITGIGTLAFEAWALPGLFKRTAHSWTLVYYATLVSFAGNILSFNLVGAVIGGVIGWYLLFQLKALYKN